MPLRFVMLPPHSHTSRLFAEDLERDLPEYRVALPESEAETVDALNEADAAYGTLPADLVRHASRLRWLQCPWAAPPPGYYSAELISHPVVVTNMRGIYTEEVATHAVMLLLALARGLPAYAAQQQRHEWCQLPDPNRYLVMSEATVLVVGLGAIGGEIARLLEPFGVELIATDARRTEAPRAVRELHGAEALDVLLPRADAVVVTVPHTPRTERLFSRQRFELMRRGSLFVNVGRGPVVDVDDLVAAIDEGIIAGAALDVLPVEPLSPEHRLWRLPEVLITPHVGSATMADEQRARPIRYRVLLGNAERFAAGKPLLNVVDKANWF